MKTFLLIAFLISLSTPALTQTKKLSSEEQDIIKSLCQKWVLTKMSAQGRSVNVPANEANYLTYKLDGNYSDSSSRFKVSHGTWIYNSKTQFLHTTELGGKSKAKVVKVTLEELIFELEYPNVTMTATYRKVE